MKIIPISNQQLTLVDDDVFEKYGALAWTAQKRKYGFHAARYFGSKYVYLHKLILNAPLGMEVHHINGDGLDNQRENLQVVSRSQHRKMDIRVREDNVSGYRGVSVNSQAGRWQAEVTDGDRKIHVGFFILAEDAARARDAKARELGWPEEGMNFPYDDRPAPLRDIRHPKLRSDSTTGYRGVSFSKQTGRFCAALHHKGQYIYVGLFDTAKDAALARDLKARELGWREDAMNFPL